MSSWASSMQTALTAEDSTVIASLLAELAALGFPPTDLAYLGSPTNQLNDRLVNLWTNMQKVQLDIRSGDLFTATVSLPKVGASFELLKAEEARLTAQGFGCPPGTPSQSSPVAAVSPPNPDEMAAAAATYVKLANRVNADVKALTSTASGKNASDEVLLAVARGSQWMGDGLRSQDWPPKVRDDVDHLVEELSANAAYWSAIAENSIPAGGIAYPDVKQAVATLRRDLGLPPAADDISY